MPTRTYNGKIPHLLKSDPDWPHRRKRWLSQEPYCRSCASLGYETLAVTVDHIIPRSRGGNHQDENLQSLCDNCHRAKCAKEFHGGLDTRVTINPDGTVYNPLKGPVTIMEARQTGKSSRTRFIFRR